MGSDTIEMHHSCCRSGFRFQWCLTPLKFGRFAPCTVDLVTDSCFATLFDESDTGADTASVLLSLDGSLRDTNPARIEYSFTVIPVPAAVWLFGSGLLGLVGIARRKA